MLLAKIAYKIFKRDYKRGDLFVLLLSMLIAMASVSSIHLVINRIEIATVTEVADVLGADLVITSPKPIEPKWLSLANELNLTQAQSVEFSSVLVVNEKMQLSIIKAVSESFPLKGQLEIVDNLNAKTMNKQGGPEQGAVWLEPRLYHQLGLQGQPSIEVGYTQLKVSSQLTKQPEQGTSLFNVAPTAVINLKDLDKTQIVQPGSRVNYRYLFAGEPRIIKQFQEKIADDIDVSQRIVSVYDESPLAGSALKRSKKFMGLASLLTILLLAIAIALSINRYVTKQFDTTALMRCFGMTNRQVLVIFCYLLLMVCLLGISLGCLFGFMAQEALIWILADFFQEALPPADLITLWLPVSVSVILLFGLSLPSLFRIQQVPPVRVLRRQLEPLKLSSWLIYGLSAGVFFIVMWLQIGDIRLLSGVFLGLVVIALIFLLIATLILVLIKRVKFNYSPAINFSLGQLQANRGVTLLHLLAFALTLFVMVLIILIRTELLDKWGKSLDANIPNHFLVNVKPNEVEPIKELFAQRNIQISELYPMVRGRIVGINGESTKAAVSPEGQSHNSLRRELNMTWTSVLPQGNEVVEGQWFIPKSKPLSISIEEVMADKLNLKIGDQLDFMIGSQAWSATISNIRSIDWQTFSPNFYIIATPGSLDDFAATYITSFFLPEEQKSLLFELVKNYPSVTLVDLAKILQEIQTIIGKLAKAIEFIMIFVIIAGLALLKSTMEHSFDTKYKQSAILRTLGASKRFINQSFRFEYIWLALLTALMVLGMIELVTYYLYQQVFEISYEFHWMLWLSVPPITITLMLMGSWYGVSKITQAEPLSLIRQN